MNFLLLRFFIYILFSFIKLIKYFNKPYRWNFNK